MTVKEGTEVMKYFISAYRAEIAKAVEEMHTAFNAWSFEAKADNLLKVNDDYMDLYHKFEAGTGCYDYRQEVEKIYDSVIMIVQEEVKKWDESYYIEMDD